LTSVDLFQLFVARVESQLEGCDKLDVRKNVNSQYERIVATMFDCLQQMAKMDGEGQGQAPGEGKDQLNYHVILIGSFSTRLDRLFQPILTIATLCLQRICIISSPFSPESRKSPHSLLSSNKLERSTIKTSPPTSDSFCDVLSPALS